MVFLGSLVCVCATRGSDRSVRGCRAQQLLAFCQALAEVARAVFARDPGAREILGLKGATPLNTAAFKAAAEQLFDNALNIAAISNALGQYGYDRERLTHERRPIAAFGQIYQAQVAAISAAQQATRDQQAALAVQADWVAQYLKVAKIALRGKPQLYEKLGGVVRSTRTSAQRQAPKKAAATRAAKKAA